MIHPSWYSPAPRTSFIPQLLTLIALSAMIAAGGCQSEKKSDQKSALSAAVIHRLNNRLADASIQDGFTPPVISRLFAYTNIAAYEAAVAGDTAFKSYRGS